MSNNFYKISKSTLLDIANAIRRKKGTSNFIPVTNFAKEIENIDNMISGKGVLIQAGTYKLVEFQYENSHPGSFAWEIQELKGKIYWNEVSNEGKAFTDISNDGEWCVYFKNNGSDVDAPLSPSWHPEDGTMYIVLDEAQFMSEEFSAWFNVCFTKADTLQAGTYKLVDYQYEYSYPGSFAWERQNLHGMFWGGDYGEYERPFTFVENDGEFCVNFVDEVDIVSLEITPSCNPVECPIKVILKKAQFISEAFSTWFNACFEKVEDEVGGDGSGDGSEDLCYTIKRGLYNDADNTTGGYYNLPWPSYCTEGNVGGELLVDGISRGSFTRIVISGYGQGGYDNNTLEGAPYPYISFFSADTPIYTLDGSGIGNIFAEISIYTDSAVSAVFFMAFKSLFHYST